MIKDMIAHLNLTPNEETLLGLKIYQPYFISNSTII